MQEMLRQANNHFVRSKKYLEEKSGLGVRAAERYREIAAKCSFTGQGSGFAYHPSFTVGETLYQFLAIPPMRKRARRKGGAHSDSPDSPGPVVTRRHKPRLKLLIPDTLVFHVEDEPQWYYTDKDGYVACMSRYEPGQAVEQFGDIRFDEDLVAVRKQSCLLPFSGLREGEDQAAVYSTGNTLSLVNTKDLRVITGASMGTDGGKAAEAVAAGGGPFLVQKFVKSKGPHAFVVRQTVERGMPPTAWMISNRQPYGEEMDHPDSLLLAGPELLGRFTTTPLAKKWDKASAGNAGNTAANTGCCNITRLGPGACVETAEAAERIKRHLEVVLDRRLQMLVADFTRDDRDRLWFLQVKAFRFMGCAPRRPFRLTATARDNARSRLRGENPSAGGAAGRPASPSPASASPAAKRPASSGGHSNKGGAAGSSRGGVESDGDGGRVGDRGARRAPGSTGAGFGVNGVKEIPHGAGLGRGYDVFGEGGMSVGGDWEAAAEAAVAAAVRGEEGSGGSGAGGRGRKSERKRLACGMCGAMRTPEDVSFRMTAKMVRETLFHIWSRLPPDQVPLSLRISDGETHAGVATAAAAAFIARNANAANDGESFAGNLDHPVPADRLSLCRILVAVTEILDVPRAFLEEAAARSRSLRLGYDLLGQREMIHLKNPVAVAGAALKAPGGCGDVEGGGGDGSAGRRGKREEEERGSLVPISVNHFRVFSFLAGNTPLKGDLPRGSGLDDFLTCQGEVVMTLSLSRPAKMGKRSRHRVSRAGKTPWLSSGRAGEAKLGLGQFRNDHVQKIELQAPMLLSGAGELGRKREGQRSQMLLVKALLGLERVRSKVNISMLPTPPSYHRGVYIICSDRGGGPEEDETDVTCGGAGYHTGDPLPEAWVQIGRFSVPSPTRAARRDWYGDSSRPRSPATSTLSPTAADALQSRFIEGTYPLFDSSSSPESVESDNDGLKSSGRRDPRQEGGQHIRTRRMSSCFGGLFDPSLELGLHLYRMGPLNNYSTADGGIRCAVASRMDRPSGDAAEGASAACPDCSEQKDGNGPGSSGVGRRRRTLCVDAMAIAIDTTVDEGGQWYVSTYPLELLCLDLCVAHRSCWNIATSRKLLVTTDTPHHLWLRGKSPDSPRVPPLPVHLWVMNWKFPRGIMARLMEGQRRLCAVEGEGGGLKGHMRRLRRLGMKPLWWRPFLQQLSFGAQFNQPITDFMWPASLQRLSFGLFFNQPIVGTAWPASLQQLSFGDMFNQPIAGVVWPASLQQISFGKYFDQTIAGVVWPASLQQLSFGDFFNRPIVGVTLPGSARHLAFGKHFNRPVDGVVWPAFLQELSFAMWFDQPIAGVEWPAPLLQLSFGDDFDQPIAGVVWPASLQKLSFGWKFNQPITGVKWPTSLKTLSFGSSFNQPIVGFVWPTLLQQLSFGKRFNQPIGGAIWPSSLQQLSVGSLLDECIVEIVWPVSLRQLSFGEYFDQPIPRVVWPPFLQQLSLGNYFDQPIASIVWPASLQQLLFGRNFDQPIVGVSWPASLQGLSFGDRFNQPIAGIVWPASLQLLSFGDGFNQSIVGVVWPASLRKVSFGFKFNQPISEVVWPAALQQLSFRGWFNQPIARVAWPASLQQLSFGDEFNQPITGVEWPAPLQQLSFGTWFNQPVAGVVWPASLQRLSFGKYFNRPVSGVA
eukprot:g3137.t1